MKMNLLLSAAVCFAVCADCAAKEMSTNELAALAAADVSRPVRPGGVNGNVFWNKSSLCFIYPPAFDFAPVEGAKSYRFTVTDGNLDEHVFSAALPYADISPVWSAVPVGYVRVRSEALDSNGRVLGVSGTRRFWKSAPYEPGAYAPKPYSYTECAKRYYKTLFAHTNTQHFLRFGRPDGYTDLLNIYPAKMNSALIRGMIRFAQIDPAHRESAMKIARNAADYMLCISQPADAPLAHFPPTYWKMEGQKSNFASVKYAGQNMLVYPASMAVAYLDLHAAVGDRKYLDAAVNIAKTYEKLQLENGTWYLKMWEKDASPVIEGNGNMPVKMLPTGVCRFMERLSRETKDGRWLKVVDKAFGYMEKGPLKTYDFAPQFEDTKPSANHTDLAAVVAINAARYLLARYPSDAARRAQAREIIRWTEDQFACWRKPCRADGRGIVSEPWHRFNPVWNPVCSMDGMPYGNWSESFDGWVDVPGVVEKYRWYVMINAVTALMIEAYLDLYRLEGDELSLAKAKTLGDSIVKVQAMGPDGEIATHWVMRDVLKGVHCTENWTNCGVGTVAALQDLAQVLEKNAQP